MLIWKLVQQLDTIVLFIYKQIMQLYYLTRKTHPINTYSPSSHSKILCSFSTPYVTDGCYEVIRMGGLQKGQPGARSSVEGSDHFGSFVHGHKTQGNSFTAAPWGSPFNGWNVQKTVIIHKHRYLKFEILVSVQFKNNNPLAMLNNLKIP